jgi:signal transduction histidine kinase
MATEDQTNRELGNRFEAEVGEIYGAMGYAVERHVPISGQEVDILATRSIPGGGPYRVMVECKYKGGTVLAGNADVQSIAGAYQIARVSHGVAACTLVTTNGFTLSAIEAARGAGIHLATRRQLVAGLIDFSSYHQRLRAEFAADFGEGEESWYVETRARQEKLEIDSLDAFVDEWLGRPQHSPLMLLGGYGTGKTSFCRHYAVRLVERGSPILPVIISLRDFQKAAHIESLFRDFLEEQCNALSPRFDTFWRMYREGMVLVFFDGFDEMEAHVDQSVLEANLVELEKFSRFGNVILTCRPEFFVTLSEERNAFHPQEDFLSERKASLERVEIQMWGAEQVSRFVEKRVLGMQPPAPFGPGYYLEHIQALPVLSDMATRAVHLEFIVRVLPQMIERGVPITRPNLYQTYIQREMRRETVQNKRLRVTSDDERLQLMRLVTAESILANRNGLDFEATAAVIRTTLQPPTSEVEAVTRDFLNRSFLRREGDQYVFAHKSLGEYLLATVIVDRIRNGDLRFLSCETLTNAVSGMVLELFGGTTAFDGLLTALGLDSTHAKRDESGARAMLFAAQGLADLVRGHPGIYRPKETDPLALYRQRLYGVYYDLMDCLQTVVLLCDMLVERRIPTDEETQSDLENTWYRTQALREELQRFLEAPSLGAALLQVRSAEVDIFLLVKSTVGIMNDQHWAIQGHCGTVFTDRVLLGRVFANLFMNATQWASDGTPVVIRLEEDPVCEGVRISCTNTGPRIPPASIDDLFEFGYTRRESGNGIGLWVVADLLELLGGAIEVTSGSTETCFTVFVPRGTSEAALA